MRANEHIRIGSGTIILPGSTIGNDAIISAGRIVTRNVLSDAILTGDAARISGKER